MTAWVLTWLWQGLALTAAIGAASRLICRLNAATRYCLWWNGLGALAAIGALSAVGVPQAAGRSEAFGVGDPLGAQATYLFEIPSLPPTLVSIFVGVWVAMALVSLVRVVPGVHTVFRLRDRCREFPPEVEAQLPLWVETRERRHTRPTRLMLCDAVRGATVLGFHRPCIAVPPSLLKALSRDELDQVVLHEYAHVQRRDDWSRLAQAVIQSALWIHPAAAIIGRRLDLEREIACDDWVVSRTGLPKLYARCLTRAAEVHGRIGMEALLGPALLSRKRQLVLRVNRLLAVKGQTRRNVSVTGAFVGTCALAVVTLQLRAIPLVGEIVDIPSVSLQADTTEPMVSYPAISDFSRTNPVRPATVIVRTTNSPGITLSKRQTHEPPSPRTAEPTDPQTAAPPNAGTDEPPNLRTAELFEPVAPALPARSFAGHYGAAEPPIAPQERGPWESAGAIGEEIGSSARKGSVAIANTFTRAGLSLARRF